MDILFSSLNVWHWAILGILFLLVELTTGSGFLLWLSIGAFLMSLLLVFYMPIAWPWQIFLFSIFSVTSSLLWWKYLKQCTEKNDKPNLNQKTSHYVGKTYVLQKAIENGRGRIKIGDTFWLVEGDDQEVNTNVKVVAVDGATLKVVKV